MTSTRTWERDWIAYARGLVNDDAHRAACDALLGLAAAARSDAGDLRWPGYLGAGYRPGGLLVAATVHREFASGRPPLPETATAKLVCATRAWRDAEVDDETWLGEMRRVYAAGLGHHWIVGRLLRSLRDRIGVKVGDVAYVNAARCQVVENEPRLRGISAIKTAVVGLCATSYPLIDVTSILQPAAIIVSKGTFDAAAFDMEIGPPIFVVDQRQLVLRRTFNFHGSSLPYGTGIDLWSPLLGKILC